MHPQALQYQYPPVSEPGEVGLNLSRLVRSYVDGATKPGPRVYLAEIARASWPKTLVGVAIATVVSTFVAFGLVLLFSWQLDFMVSQVAISAPEEGFALELMRQILTFLRDALTFWAFATPLLTVAGYFFTVGLQFVAAKALGGQGATFRTHAYLASLSYTPFTVASLLLSFVPLVSILGAVLPIYQVVCVGFAIEASQRLTTGKAMLAAFAPTILFMIAIFFAVLILTLTIFNMFAQVVPEG